MIILHKKHYSHLSNVLLCLIVINFPSVPLFIRAGYDSPMKFENRRNEVWYLKN